MRIPLIRSLALLFAVFSLNGCGSGGSAPSGRYGALTIAGATNKRSYSSGETVNFTLTVTNTGSSPLAVSGSGLSFPGNSSVPLTVEIEKNGQHITWLLNNNGVNGFETLAPGEVATNTADWDQKDDNSAQVPPGTYTLRMFMSADRVGNQNNINYANALAAPPVYIEIQ